MAEATEKKTRRRRTKAQIEAEASVKAEENVTVQEAEPVQKTLEEPVIDKATFDALIEQNQLMKEQNKVMQEQIEALKEQVNNARPQVIQMAMDTEMIEFLWLAPVANDNELLIADGLYGKITGKIGNFAVPKRELSRVLDSATRRYLENRWMIVLSGLTDEERRMYGVDYKPGETLTRDIFMRLTDMGADIIPIYKELCDASKEVVAILYYEAWLDPAQKHKIDRNTIVALNKISSNAGWKTIIEEMNRAEAE